MLEWSYLASELHFQGRYYRTSGESLSDGGCTCTNMMPWSTARGASNVASVKTLDTPVLPIACARRPKIRSNTGAPCIPTISLSTYVPREGEPSPLPSTIWRPLFLLVFWKQVCHDPTVHSPPP
jgi:hypothetical protein